MHPSAATAAARRVHAMPFGATVMADGSVHFRVWAPVHAAMWVAFSPPADGFPTMLPVAPCGDGWHELVTHAAGPGTCYRFVLPDGTAVPDPASRHQPAGVHGPSEVIDPAAHVWRDATWRGRPWHEAVLYETHVGTFTPAGTFRAAIDRLDHLVALGITALSLMPVADFPGRRNWGYDGVLPYAPAGAYGRPEDLKALIEAAHGRGLMVLLDVVYNHLGPEGNYFPALAPPLFTDRHTTPWGAALNFDGADSRPVRDFFVHNALYWLEEFHLDGLRLDAVHAIRDDSTPDLLDELAARVCSAMPGRHVHLVLENEANAAHRLARLDSGVPRAFTAQWNDDVHHVLHVAATGESAGYYADYAGDSDRLGRALAEGFAFQGEHMPYRGAPRGEPSAGLPPTAFVAFTQNHDQIGNRAFGERLDAIAPAEAVRAVVATCLLLPQIPMLFMGEEWATARPFPFFCDFGPELADAVREGRRAEFARFPEFQDEAARSRIPDPTTEATFTAAKLDWDAAALPSHAERLAWYRRLLAVRHAAIVPLLPAIPIAGRHAVVAPGAVVVRWQAGDIRLMLAANLSAAPVAGFPVDVGRVLWREGAAGADGVFAPWSVCWTVAPASAEADDA